MYRKKSLGDWVFQTSDPFTLLTSSGLIESRRAYHEVATPTTVMNLKKKTQQSPNYLMATAHHSDQSDVDIAVCIFLAYGLVSLY